MHFVPLLNGDKSFPKPKRLPAQAFAVAFFFAWPNDETRRFLQNLPPNAALHIRKRQKKKPAGIRRLGSSLRVGTSVPCGALLWNCTRAPNGNRVVWLRLLSVRTLHIVPFLDKCNCSLHFLMIVFIFVPLN